VAKSLVFRSKITQEHPKSTFFAQKSSKLAQKSSKIAHFHTKITPKKILRTSQKILRTQLFLRICFLIRKPLFQLAPKPRKITHFWLKNHPKSLKNRPKSLIFRPFSYQKNPKISFFPSANPDYFCEPCFFCIAATGGLSVPFIQCTLHWCGCAGAWTLVSAADCRPDRCAVFAAVQQVQTGVGADAFVGGLGWFWAIFRGFLVRKWGVLHKNGGKMAKK
jgi:hypothetical protein